MRQPNQEGTGDAGETEVEQGSGAQETRTGVRGDGEHWAGSDRSGYEDAMR